jgi:hypothetical protein
MDLSRPAVMPVTVVDVSSEGVCENAFSVAAKANPMIKHADRMDRKFIRLF